jgi:hypothetical protein
MKDNEALSSIKRTEFCKFDQLIHLRLPQDFCWMESAILEYGEKNRRRFTKQNR